jgi:uncharacterized protein (TIGR03083 family)
LSEERLRQLIAAHDAVFTGLLDATAGLDGDGWATPTGCPGWDVHDQLAHCIGVERMMLGDPIPEIEVPDLPHLRNDMARFIERDVEVRRGVDGEELRDEARDTFDRRLAWLESMTTDDLDREIDSPIGRTRASKVLRTRIFDLVAHEQDVRRALGRETELVGAHAELAIEQVLRAWAVMLASKLPEGRVLAVEVPGRAPVVLGRGSGHAEEATGQPPADATVELTPSAVLTLGCGREDAPSIDEVQVRGDRGLVEAFLEVAAITP